MATIIINSETYSYKLQFIHLTYAFNTFLYSLFILLSTTVAAAGPTAIVVAPLAHVVKVEVEELEVLLQVGQAATEIV